MEAENYLELMVTAALKAGRVIMEVYEREEIWSKLKDDQSPLTEADQLSDQVIHEHLQVTGIPILSEETVSQPWEVRSAWERCWIVDPLDGTKEFLKRNGEFTVNIALAMAGNPVAGVIFAPATGELYFGAIHSGAYKVDISQGNSNLTPAELLKKARKLPMPQPADKVFTVVASRSHRNAETDGFISELERRHEAVTTLSRGSSLKICMVAEGLAEVYPRFAPTMEWDTAAGNAIALAAGCRIYNPSTGGALTYNKEDLKNPWFIVERI